jgi:hypothetical protein
VTAYDFPKGAGADKRKAEGKEQPSAQPHHTAGELEHRRKNTAPIGADMH